MTLQFQSTFQLQQIQNTIEITKEQITGTNTAVENSKSDPKWYTSIIREQMAPAMPSPCALCSPAIIVRSVMMGFELTVSSDNTIS